MEEVQRKYVPNTARYVIQKQLVEIHAEKRRHPSVCRKLCLGFTVNCERQNSRVASSPQKKCGKLEERPALASFSRFS